MAISKTYRLAACLGFLIPPTAQAAESCFARLAATRNYTLGTPRHVTVSPDGTHAFYLRSAPRDATQRLYEYDLATHTERALASPPAAPETLSTEEKARRERARMTLTGITDFSLSEDGATLLATQADHLIAIALPSGKVSPIPGQSWIAPRLSPDGKSIAVVQKNDLHVITMATGADTELTTGGSDDLTHGLAEFAAAEELDRADGAWWSPDSQNLIYEEADNTHVEMHYIADPAHPAAPPTAFRYPRAGTENARTRLGIVARTGGPTTWLTWDHDAFPYIARVIWPKSGKLSIVVLNRAQTEERILAADPATGQTTTLLTENDPAWVNIAPMHGPGFNTLDLPRWLPNGAGFLWAAERGPYWQLELHHPDGTLDHAITPKDVRYDALDDLDATSNPPSVVVTASPTRTDFGLYRIPLAGGAPIPIAAQPGFHDAIFTEGQHTLFAERQSLADGTAANLILHADGTPAATIPSQAETPPAIPKPQYLTTGPDQLDALILHPTNFTPGRKYPVILSVYAGPDVKNVLHTPRSSFEDQCLADHGFITVTIDGRGTPGRDHDFERAIKNNLIDAPLADQIEGLQSLSRQFPEMDMHHVGVEGWSFGGYFTAMATTRRPDVFSAGAAGAPVVDFADYDTAYTERYLGTPQANPAAYKVSNVLTYAATLQNPLLIMHGLTDDNVYFENTVKLTQALTLAGKPYQLLLLPGTHQLSDPTLRTRVNDIRAQFLAAHLK